MPGIEQVSATNGEHWTWGLTYNFVRDTLRKVRSGSGGRGDAKNDQIRIVLDGDAHNSLLHWSEFNTQDGFVGKPLICWK